ncbi:MAG: hypothetical protein Q8940_22275, partial [Bacteroidota bacterium]|nr:hypothetical protein [Bacteroidota bacterium]
HMMPYSLWTNKGFPLFTCSGWGLFSNKTGKWKKEPLIDSKFMNRIRGNAPNDIFVAGDYGFLAHWNGLTWKVYDEFSDNGGSIFRVAVKGNTIAAIGILRGSAVAIIGKRQYNTGPVVNE